MIQLPAKPIPNQMQPALLDYGFMQRGASSLRVDRAGSRYRITFGFPPMFHEEAAIFTSRFQRGKRQGIQIRVPTLRAQGFPGTPVVDGAGQSGSSIDLTGFNVGYAAKEGFWLTIVEADGTAYLHTVATTAVADALGEMTLEIEPPLRAPFADGDTVEIGAPYMQGFVDGENFEWGVRTDRYVELSVTVEEYQ